MTLRLPVHIELVNALQADLHRAGRRCDLQAM